ncbi:aspartate carbamoyltransferase catalytic subunit [Tropicimonas aquimaris]|uniref:Aspartate carbamoyltransferase catalytic subunit n=1 Tax=Tropicimonas aquimaris TaxID=914152 RepID=A0ABW3IU91_9RHOB
MTEAAGDPVPTGWEGILHPGERILWQGRPSGEVTFAGLDPRRTIFGIAFLCVALIWTSKALSLGAGAPLPMRLVAPLAGAFFVFQGAWLAGGERLWQAYARRRSWYTLTSRRALIATELFGKRALQDWPITPRTVIDLVEGPPASVLFADSGRRFAGGRRIGFEMIEDGREVLSLMRQVQRGAS